MTLRILAIGDTANNAYILSQIVTKSHIDIINFPRIGAAKFTNTDNVQFFESYLISNQVKKINEIKSNYDLCLVHSWEGARVAFLANLNYIFFIVGGSANEQPFIKNARTSYLKEPIHKKNFFERWFLKQVLNSAITCVTYGGQEFVDKLKKFHSNVYRMDMIQVNEIFFKKHTPINKEKKKFTFLSPQRQGLEKGMDVIWKAIELSKSDFVMLQVEWFDRRTPEENKISEEFKKNKPQKIEFISMIQWEKIPNYYAWADAVMGQMRSRHGSIEREAVLCGTPVLNYSNPNEKYLIGNKEFESEFLPKSNDPQVLADTIDKLVEDEKFRDTLYKDELKFVKMLTDTKIISSTWDELFEQQYKKFKKINGRKSRFSLLLLNFTTKLFEKMVYKKRWEYKR